MTSFLGQPTSLGPVHILPNYPKGESKKDSHYATQQTSWSPDDLYASASRNGNRTPSIHDGQQIKSIKLQWDRKVLKASFIVKRVSLFTHSCEQREPPGLIIQFFSTAYEQWICLLAIATTANSTATTPEIPVRGPYNDSCVKRLVKMLATILPLLQLIPSGPKLMKVSNIKARRARLEIFERRSQC